MDLIDRQAAVDALVEWYGCEPNDIDAFKEIVEALPSAQPERLTDYSFEESCTECPAYDTENHRCPRFNQVIRTALKDANLEPCEDCISRQAAIDAADRADYTGLAVEDVKKVTDEVVKELKQLPSARPNLQQTCNQLATDCISRQAALDAVFNNAEHPDKAYEAIRHLPSAQPEIIRCKDCKHRIEHKHYGNMGESAYTCEGNMAGWILPDDFCSHAERRTDD